MRALERQVGGDHYKGLEIQPAMYNTKNKIGFLAGNVIKRISRYNKPGGKGLEDLEKIKHEIDLLIEIEEWIVEGANEINPADLVFTQEPIQPTYP